MSSADRPCRDSRRHGAVSRRACLSALATVAVVPALPARAQIDWHKVDIWQVYRREDLGYRGRDAGRAQDRRRGRRGTCASINAEVELEGVWFAITYHTFTHAMTVKDVSARQHEALRNLNIEAKITRESDITMNEFPGLEFVAELQAARFAHIMRVIVMKDRAISVAVFGEPGVHANPLARRFLGSFKLLTGAR